MTTFRREAIERQVRAEDASFRRVIELLVGKEPFASWPEPLALALAGAVTPPGTGRHEDAKAAHLLDHLTLGLAALPAAGDAARTRLAERLRADLAACVPPACLLDVLLPGHGHDE